MKASRGNLKGIPSPRARDQLPRFVVIDREPFV